MAIINTAPVPSTLEEKKSYHKRMISAQINGSFSDLQRKMAALIGMVWNNPDLTPQEIFDAFGSDAAQLFLIAGSIQTAMNTIQPGSVPFTPPAYQINKDGTVTVL